MAKSVFCIAKTEPQAEKIMGDLRAAGFSHDDVSMLFADTTIFERHDAADIGTLGEVRAA
jgi:hypothetical protein